MPSRKNTAVIASAGSGKTTFIVDRALALDDKRVLITTYTNENLAQIRSMFVRKHGCIPSNVHLVPWFTFVLREGIRPYQRAVINGKRIESIDFLSTAPRVARADPVRFFTTGDGKFVHRDRASDLVCSCDEASGGLVVRRLEEMYDHIFVDEMQDLAGHDLEFIDRLFRSSMEIMLVGDPRQGTFTTNRSAKNKRYRRSGILEWVNERAASGVLTREERTECHRCNQAICDFADALYPDFPATSSTNKEVTNHDGVHTISKDQVIAYWEKYQPVVLRRNRNVDTFGLPAANFGASKGSTFDRVMIFTTEKMRKYLRTGNLEDAGDIPKLYVAVTRAKYSVTFVI